MAGSYLWTSSAAAAASPARIRRMSAEKEEASGIAEDLEVTRSPNPS
jgi:hypothetical protein